jgi:hypothetical protein
LPSRDGVGVTAHELTYRGPASFAVQAAALIADADGIELTSAARADNPDGPDESVVLVLTVQGTDEAVAAGLDAVRGELPAGATMG